MKIKLKHPITHGAETITELELRRPKAKDMRDLPLQGMGMDHMLDLAGRCAGQPPSVINELDIEDVMQVAEVVGNFMTNGLPTGGKR